MQGKIEKVLKMCVISFCMYIQSESYSVAVIGAGPAGVIAVGVLLDAGVPASEILWCDEEFSVGRMGRWYAEVPANNSAERFISFFNECHAFGEVDTPAVHALRTADPERIYTLKLIVDPLQDVTNHFLSKVSGVRGRVEELSYADDMWNIRVQDQWHQAQRVIIATGCHPRSLGYACPHEISLDIALTKDSLAQQVSHEDTVAVIGDAHSAVLVMKYLHELGAGRIINFYRHPLLYLPDKCERQNEYLGGIAAEWAREVLDKNPPAHLIRMKSCRDALAAWMPICTKIIYAAGFERNPLPIITGISVDGYDTQTGIIGPHLFGLGIAFPEIVYLDETHCRYEIGLKKFIQFAQRMMPTWLTKSSLSYEDHYDDFVHVYYMSMYAAK
jgi:hypothetical protein